jgi:Holliday junction resolvase RusA-like endonuclease
LQGCDVPFLSATLPLPPSVNGSYRIVQVPGQTTIKGNKTIRLVNRLGSTPELESFKYEAAIALQQDSILDDLIVESIRASSKKIPLRIIMRFYFPTMWLRDIDGGIKAVQDACFLHLGMNDNQVVQLVTEKFADKANPRCEVEISIVGK